MIVNYYNTLNIENSADINSIKKAFRKQITIYHPENNKTEEAKSKFIMVVEAYDVLSIIEKRKAYDAILMLQTKNLPVVIEQTEIYESWQEEAKTKAKSYSVLSLDNLFLSDIFAEVGVNSLILGSEVLKDSTEPIVDGLGDIIGDVIGGIFDGL